MKPSGVQMHCEHELYQPDVCKKYQLNRDDQDAGILRGICSGGISLTTILIFPISRRRSSTPLILVINRIYKSAAAKLQG